MKLLHYGKDGGPDSTVWGFWLIEAKSLFSIALLCFEDGSREAYHNHAFNSISWLLKGILIEKHLSGNHRVHIKSFKPIKTSKDTFHKVHSMGRSWVLTFRGPWSKEWKEYLPDQNKVIILEHGRRIKT